MRNRGRRPVVIMGTPIPTSKSRADSGETGAAKKTLKRHRHPGNLPASKNSTLAVFSPARMHFPPRPVQSFPDLPFEFGDASPRTSAAITVVASAAITVVANATNNVDADAGSIRHVATVSAAAVLTALPARDQSVISRNGSRPILFEYSVRYCSRFKTSRRCLAWRRSRNRCVLEK